MTLDRIRDVIGGQAARFRGYAGALVIAVGLAVMAVAFVRFLGTHDPRQRMDFAFSGATYGIGLVLTGGVVLVLEWLHLHAERELRDSTAVAELLSDRVTALVVPAPRTATSRVLLSEWSFHASDCPLTRDRSDLTEVAIEAATASGASPCRMCLPGVS